jgi:glycosyltransferase involved in cell wall biosynthesis
LLPDFEGYERYLLQADESSCLPEGLWDSGLGTRLAALRTDVVVFNDWVFADLVAPLSAHVPVLMICNSHQPSTNYYSMAPRFSNHLRAILGVSGVIVSALKNHLAEEHHAMVHEVRNGIEVPATWNRRRPWNSDRIRLIYLGRLEQEYKRILDIVDLAVELDRRSVRAEILLVGTGPDRQLLERRIAETPTGNVAFRFYGHLKHEEGMELLADCDVLVLMSDTEGLPLAMLEAAARGVVPVVTRLPNGVEDYFADGISAFMFEPGDIVSAAQIISDLNRDRDLLERAASSARRVAEHFDLTVSLRSFATLLRDAAAQAPDWQAPPR